MNLETPSDTVNTHLPSDPPQPSTAATTDSIPTHAWGDTMTPIPRDTQPSTLRLAFQNARGIYTYQNWSEWIHTCRFINQHHIGIFGTVETNTQWTTESKHQMHSLAKRHLTTPRTIATSCSHHPTSSPYQPGGSLLLSSGRWTRRCHQASADPTGMGRWTHLRLEGKHKIIVNILCVYRVCLPTRHETSTSNTAYLQQSRHLRNANNHTCPRDQLLLDIGLLVQNWTHHDQETIILIDANEPASLTSKWATFMSQHNLFNAHAMFHSETPPSTNINGSKQIDFIACSPRVIECISKAGFLAFDTGPFTSDHRCLFIDLDASKLLQSRTNDPILSAKKRKIFSKDHRCRTKYLTELGKLCLNDDIPNQIHALLHLPPEDFSQENEHDLNQLDRLLTQHMLKAEHKCGRPSIAWSPKFRLHHQIVQFWSLRVSLAHKPRSSWHILSQLSREITSMLKEIQVDDPTSSIYSIDPAMHWHSNLRKAKRTFRKIIDQAIHHRHEFLAQRHLDCTNSGKQDVASIIKRIIQAEAKRTMFQRFDRYINPPSDSNMNYLEIPDNGDDPKDPNTSWSRIDDIDTMNTHLTAYNKKHFAQAQGTPFTISPLSDALQHHSITDTGNDILNDTYQPPATVDPITRHLLRYTTRRCPDHNKKDISHNEFRQVFKHWKESTSTSPSGRHLGHMKSLTYIDDTDEWPSSACRPQELFITITNIVNLCVQHCLALDRWLTVHNMLIQKEAGNQKIHRLRVIHIQEADWQAFLKLSVTRTTIHHAHHHQALHPNQYGGVPGSQAITPAVLNINTQDYLRMTITPAAVTYKDAASCYDRLVEPYTNLALRAIGCSPSHLRLHSAVHQRMRYHIKTANGIAPDYCHHNPPTEPFWGAGQGACDAAARCTAVSSCIFYAYQNLCSPLTLSNPTNTSSLDHTLLAFVDDATTTIPLPTATDFDAITNTITHHVSTWEQLQHSAGGKLNIEKCNIAFFLWKQNELGIPELVPHTAIPIDISIKNSQTQRTYTIPILPTNSAYKYLGVHQCPDGSTAPQIQALIRKSNKYARALAACPLNRNEIYAAYFTCYIPSITYPLPACTLSQSVLRDIDRPVINITLTKMGFNRKFPREVVYSPRHFGGIGLRDLYCEQGIGQIKFLISNIRANNDTGRRLLINIEQYQLLAGISQPILECTHPIPGTRNLWLTHLRTFLHSIDCQIRLHQPWTFPSLRLNDVHLMDVITTSSTWSNEEKTIFNTVRQYLHVTTLAELRTNDGRYFHHGAFGQTTPHGQPEIFSIFCSQLDWPSLQRPPDRAMRKWKQMLIREFRHLPPLGNWLSPAISQVNFWRYSLALLIGSNTQLWIHDFNTEFHTELNPHSDRRRIYINCRRVQSYPIDHDNYYDGPDDSNTPLIPNLTHKHFEGPFFHKTVHQDTDRPCGTDHLHRQILDSIQWTIDLTDHQSIRQILTNDSLLLVADGGHKHSGSYAWVVATSSQTIIAKGDGHVTGSLAHMSSFRAESTGILHGAIALKHILHLFADNDPELTSSLDLISDNKLSHPISIYSDSLSLITRLREWIRYPTFYPSIGVKCDSDLCLEIIGTLHQHFHRNDLTFHHVRGHQDEKKPWDLLTWPEKLNCECDKRASATLLSAPHHDRPHHHTLFYPHCDLLNNGIPLTNKISETIRQIHGSKNMRSYLCSKFSWNTKTCNHIDWLCHGRALSRFPISHQTFIVKLIHEWLPLHHRRNKINRHHTTLCPVCTKTSETPDHFLKCNAPPYNQLFNNLLRAVCTHCDTWGSSDDTKRLLLLGLQHWPSPLINSSEYPHPFKYLIRCQHHIGWKHLFYGRFATEWIYLHELTANPAEPKHKDGERWLTELIVIIWTHLRLRWLKRNDLNHDDSDTPTATAQAHEAEIKDLYANKHNFNANCSPIFRTPLQTLLNKPRTTIASWIDHNLPFLRRNRITPTPPPPCQSQRPASTSTSRSDVSTELKTNENTKISSNTTLTPIRLRSERVSSPRAVPSVNR